LTVLAASPSTSIASSPMSYLRTAGPSGDPTTLLGWGLGIIAVGVLLVIAALLLWGVLRPHARPADSRALTVRADAGGMPWIYVGVGVTTVVLVGCAVWTMFTLAAIAMPARAADLTLQVSAAQWWWGVRYQNSDPSKMFPTANEIHIPVGRPIRVELSSTDVIHSFWIPQLAGKMDVIPGQTNVTWIQASKPGIYRGQCGEFCGAQHAHMAMEVVADEPPAFAAWAARQLEGAALPEDAATLAGARVFSAHCAACHAVRGTAAGGIFGPDLTHLMSRQTIAAGLMANNAGNLSAWLSNPQALKPGTRMPNPILSASELRAVVAYLDTLK
jgi:cytochrome c oxidase subunit II